MIARALIPIIKPWGPMWISRDQMVMRDNIVRVKRPIVVVVVKHDVCVQVCKRYALCGLSSPAHAPQSPEQAHGPLYYDGDVVALCPTNESGKKMAPTSESIVVIAQELNMDYSSVEMTINRLVEGEILQPCA